VDVQPHDPHSSISFRLRFASQELAGNAATTDPRSRRIRASRKAIALGVEAVKAGRSVYFGTLADLVAAHT
jgi:hypothetical protein